MSFEPSSVVLKRFLYLLIFSTSNTPVLVVTTATTGAAHFTNTFAKVQDVHIL